MPDHRLQLYKVRHARLTRRPRRPGWLAALLCGAILSGCAGLEAGRLVEAPGDLPARARVAGVPFHPQTEAYCGPAALATVLGWSGLEVSQQAVAAQVFTPGRTGTLRSDMAAGARRHGRLAIPVRGMEDLLTELAAGHPVVVFQNLALDWWPRWHYAVAYGYDLPAREVHLRSGTTARRVVALAAFERTWARGDDWGLVVTPPGRLPATARERPALEAAHGLERAGRPRAAATAYATIVKRWPESYAARMALGNIRYGLGEPARAEAAFRAAAALRPQAPAPRNNLAYALAAQGRRDAAVAAARTAVRLAETAGDPAPYRDTLTEMTTAAGL